MFVFQHTKSNTCIIGNRVLKEFFSARVSDGSINANPMNTVKPYTKDFVLAHQQGVREDREKAIKKKNSGADLTE